MRTPDTLGWLCRIVLAVLAACATGDIVLSADFDCRKAVSALEKTICADEQLDRLDEEMGRYYTELWDALPTKRSQVLLTEQRSWLLLRTSKCPTSDADCLQKLYEERLQELQARYDNGFVRPALQNVTNRLQGLRGSCELPELPRGQDFIVYAAGAYGGRKLNVQIDQSGSQATQFDIVVNSVAEPVALVLSASEPSIWNIEWTEGTYIVAVIASGHHRQAVAGLPRKTPLLISSDDNDGPCGSPTVSKEKGFDELDDLSKRVYGKPIAMAYRAEDVRVVLGQPLAGQEKVLTSGHTKPADLVDRSQPLAGSEGLADAVSKGLLRPATQRDLQLWADRRAKALFASFLPSPPRHLLNGFVILKPMQIPAGVYWHTFFLAEGVPPPTGDLSHSALYDFNTMKCRGFLCERL